MSGRRTGIRSRDRSVTSTDAGRSTPGRRSKAECSTPESESRSDPALKYDLGACARSTGSRSLLATVTTAYATIASPNLGPAPSPTVHAESQTHSALTSSWPGFRGPHRDGVYREPIRLSWEGLAPMWKKPIGGGRSSFAVAGGRAFTIEQRQRNEVVVAYDVMTGRELWTNAWPERFSQWMGGGEGPRATPTWADGFVFALGARGELRCLDAASGRLVWRTNILQDAGAENLRWGMAGSPLIVGRRGDRAARRTGRSIGRGLRSPDGQAVVDGARRQAGLRLADAGHAPWRPAIPGRQRRAVGGTEPRSARRAVGVPVDDRSRRDRAPSRS